MLIIAAFFNFVNNIWGTTWDEPSRLFRPLIYRLLESEHLDCTNPCLDRDHVDMLYLFRQSSGVAEQERDALETEEMDDIDEHEERMRMIDLASPLGSDVVFMSDVSEGDEDDEVEDQEVHVDQVVDEVNETPGAQVLDEALVHHPATWVVSAGDILLNSDLNISSSCSRDDDVGDDASDDDAVVIGPAAVVNAPQVPVTNISSDMADNPPQVSSVTSSEGQQMELNDNAIINNNNNEWQH